MKRFVSTWIIAATMAALLGCSDKKPTAPTPTTTPTTATPPKPPPPPPLTPEEKQKALYAFGTVLAQRTPVGQAGLSETDLAEVIKGLKDTVEGKEPAVKPEEGGPLVDRLLKGKEEARSAEQKKKGEAFLLAAAKEKGAQKLPSGLIMVSEKAGSGPSPTPTDRVKVNYRGTLTDGTEFDSSFKRGQPAEFPVNGVIKCWTEGLQKMKPGGKAKLVCPFDIAYGERGTPNIPPYSTLVFEVELLSVQPPAPVAPIAPVVPGAKPPQPLPKGHPEVK